MNFGTALLLCKKGQFIARKAWVDAFVYYVPPSCVPVTYLRGNARRASDYGAREFVTQEINGHFDLFSEDKSIVVGWSPTQEDMQANDWTALPK